MNAFTEFFNEVSEHNPQVLFMWKAGRLCFSEAARIIALQALDEIETTEDKETRRNLAERIEALDPYAARNAYEDPAAGIYNDIQNDPEAVIDYLLTIIEERNA